MKKVYINGVGLISTQKTFDNSEFLSEITNYTAPGIFAISPNYKEYISAGEARRMAKGVKMGVVSSKIALEEAGLDTVDAVITGTGMGCVVESERFVKRIIDNNEQFLTPTSFIQSTHNTVGGQIALGIQCKGYNFTYVHSSSSFESALVDASLQLMLDEAGTVLVGGVDELGAHMLRVYSVIKHVKQEEVIDNLAVLKSNTKGAVFSEGATFMVLSNTKEEKSYAELVDVEIYNTVSREKIEEKTKVFLSQNNMAVSDVDAVILGNNGDIEFDGYFDELSKGVFANTQQLYYKHLSGEHMTVSSFGNWLGAKIMKTQTVPDVVKLNNMPSKPIKNILIYNQYRGENHTFVMLQSC
jgi:3-oxoacyl-[acyl-carrier-protein] synthase III